MTLALSSLETGKIATVAHIQTQDNRILQKLTAMGILPGVKIVVEQRWPSYIIKVGQSRVALDQAIVEKIYLEP